MPGSTRVTTRSSVRAARGTAALTWLLAAALGLWALALRLWRLGDIHSLIFDEVYYVRDAYTLTREGVEHEWAKDISKAAFESGDVNSYLDSAAYVVHPPIGKWIIGLGEMALGVDNAWGWRISVALVGTLTVVLMFFTVKRLLGNLSLAVIAAFLMSIDGVHIVHSRTSLLDLILMAFVLLAFFFLLVDRDQFRRRLATKAFEGSGTFGARFFTRAEVRWYRLAAGISLGLACGVKWSGLYFLAVFGILTVMWDWAARKAAGDPRWAINGLVRDAIPAFFAMVGSAFVVYVASWAGWFASSNGYYRVWAKQEGLFEGNPIMQALASLWKYHLEMYKFHVGLDSEHTYSANPLLWPLQLRPTNFYYRSYAFGEMGCKVEKCSAAINSLGNPLLWWLASAAVLVTLVVAVIWRDWRAFAILSGIVGGYVPWLMYMNRTIFQFYSIAFEPWMVMALVYCFGLILGGHAASKARRYYAGLTVGVLVCLIALTSAFFWPIWTGEVIPFEQWQARMWLESWI